MRAPIWTVSCTYLSFSEHLLAKLLAIFTYKGHAFRRNFVERISDEKNFMYRIINSHGTLGYIVGAVLTGPFPHFLVTQLAIQNKKKMLEVYCLVYWEGIFFHESMPKSESAIIKRVSGPFSYIIYNVIS